MGKWDRFFMGMADYMATASKDPSSQVGAVLVNTKRQVIGMGYNGFPRGVDDDPGLYADRPTKYRRVVHAEVNAVLNATAATDGATAFVTHPCCSQCMALLIQAGVKRIVYRGNEALFERMGDSLNEAIAMALEACVEIEEIQ